MDPRPLPPGFISQYDPNTQRYFYVDTNTGVSQWNHPLDVKPPFSPPPSEGRTDSGQYPAQFPSNPQGHYPLGFTDSSSLSSSGYPEQRPSMGFPQPSNYPPTTYGRGDQMPESNTNPYAMMQQQSYSSYSQPQQPPRHPPPPQPTPFNYPSSYPQSAGYYEGSERPSEYSDDRTGHKPHGEAKSHEKEKHSGGMGGMGKMLLGAGVGATGALLAGELLEHNKHKHKHKKKGHKGWKGWKGKGWKGKGWKGWKGKGWKGKGWKGKGWKGWK